MTSDLQPVVDWLNFDDVRPEAAPQGAVVDQTDAEYDEERRAKISLADEKFSYINVYLADRAYGGPEEGGWYYDYGVPVESRRVLSPTDYLRPENYVNPHSEYETELAFLTARYDRLNQGRPEVHSVNSVGRYIVIEEDGFANGYPETIPHYE